MAAKNPPIQIELNHICNRSKIGTDGAAIQKTVVSTGSGSVEVIPVSESLKINKQIKECQYYEKNSTCGCGRALCKIGKGQPDTRNNDGHGLVSFWDCANCLYPDVKLYKDNAYKKIT